MLKKTLLAGLAALAIAATPVAALAETHPGNIDTTKTTSLTVHKFDGAPNINVPNDGRELTPEELAKLNAKPLGGITFDVYRITNLTVNTNDGIAAAAGVMEQVNPLTVDPATGFTVGGTTYTMTKETSITTAADGTATAASLPQGMYFVVENLASSTNPDIATVTPARPFFVMLPLTDPTTQSAWDYDPDVYPKNQTNTITKAVMDGAVGTTDKDAYQAGQNLTYQMKSTIVAVDTSGDGKVTGTDDLGMWSVGDNMQQGMEYVSSTVSIAKADGSTEALAENTDYKVTPSSDKRFVQWTMTTAGLDKLAANNGGHVVIDTVAKVTTDAIPTNGEVKNTAYLIPSWDWFVTQGPGEGTIGTPPGDPSTPPYDTPPTKPGIPSNEVVSKYGDVAIKKVDTKGANLAGATFALYRAVNDSCADLSAATPIQQDVVSDDSGWAIFPDVQLSDFYDGATQTTLHNYCIVETKAPDGFELLPEPVKVSLTTAGETTKVDGSETTRVTNAPSNEGEILPIAGGIGTAPTVALSVLVVAAAGYGTLTLVRKKRKEA